MTEYPSITICMTTYFVDQQRKELAKETLKSWQKYLIYEGEINLHISDDGSTLQWYPEKVYQSGYPSNRKMDVTFSRQERHGVGASLNAGFRKAFESSPLVAYFVDDWLLTEPLNITPWCKALLEREDIGIIRLGPPHPFLSGKIEILSEEWQGWGLTLDRYGLTVGHRPEIFHQRYIDYYGWWDEDINAQEVERLASVRYCTMPDGPKIVLALPHKFFHNHLDVVPSTSHIEPELLC